MTDYYSEYFEIEKLTSLMSAAIIRQTKKWVATHGIPAKITTDNGPSWNSLELQKFAQLYAIQHITILPTHSQSNGLVEKAVGIQNKINKIL